MFLSLLQIKKKLPKVNRHIYQQILENEEAETKRKDGDNADVETTKKSKKRKGPNAEFIGDERFKRIFMDQVLHLSVNTFQHR